MRAVCKWVYEHRLYEMGPRGAGAADFIAAMQALRSFCDPAGYAFVGLRAWAERARRSVGKISQYRNIAMQTGFAIFWQEESGRRTTKLKPRKRTHCQLMLPDYVQLSDKDEKACSVNQTECLNTRTSHEESITQLEVMLAPRRRKSRDLCPSMRDTDQAKLCRPMSDTDGPMSSDARASAEHLCRNAGFEASNCVEVQGAADPSVSNCTPSVSPMERHISRVEVVRETRSREEEAPADAQSRIGERPGSDERGTVERTTSAAEPSPNPEPEVAQVEEPSPERKPLPRLREMQQATKPNGQHPTEPEIDAKILKLHAVGTTDVDVIARALGQYGVSADRVRAVINQSTTTSNGASR